MKVYDGLVVIGFLTLVLALAQPVGAAENVDLLGASNQSSILKISPGLSPATLAGRPDSELVQLPSGRLLKMGALRRVSSLSRKLKQSKGQPVPQALSYKPAATGIQLKNGADLAAALKRSDSETVQLPSGRRATVGMLRYLQPQVEQRLGRKLATAGPSAVPTGPAIKIKNTTDKDYWKNILQQPDATVLEAPDGQRITVGDLKLSFGPVTSAAPVKRNGGRP